MAVVLLVPTTADARQAGNPVEALTRCRALADASARLACFDTAAAAIETAQTRKEIVVLDRTEVKKTRRSLFGFTLPRIKFLEGDGKEEAETEIETTIESARSLGYGKWSLRTAEGATWQTSEALQDTPRAGTRIMIRRGSLGSFFLKVDKLRAVRATRVG